MNSEYRWLNESSEVFLQRGYLLEGQTVDERVHIIADTAEKILGIDRYAEKFVSYFKKGWFSLSTPIWTNFGNDRGLGISCVVGDTWINTESGGGKQARNIELGDKVLTHKGRYRPVTDIIKTEKRDDIYKLKITNRMTPLYLTGDHLVLTNLGWVRTDELDISIHMVAINREIELPKNSDYSIEMIDFAPEDFIVHEGLIKKRGSINVKPSKQVEFIENTTQVTSTVSLNEDLAWALGLWFAKGSLTRDPSGKPNGIRITVNDDDEIDKAELWLNIIKKSFNINGMSCNSSRKENGDSWYTINANSIIVGNYFSSFGDNCKSKLIPDFIIQSEDKILEEFLRGLLGGDGTPYENGNNKITLANPKMILQVYQIGLKLGYNMSLQMQEKAGKLASTSHVYTVLFRPYKNGRGRFSTNSAIAFSDGLSYAPIRDILKTDKVETVYDFTVEEDHSFSAAGVILHNCFGSHINDDMGSILRTHAEVGMMSKYGGGTSGYFGDLRGRGEPIRNNGDSFGSVHFMQLFDKLTDIVSQGKSRRGNFAAYLPVDHKDIYEFLKIRSEGNPIQEMYTGVCVTDEWMQSMIDGDTTKRKVWAKVLETRAATGFPYIFWTDNVNNNTVDVYKDKNLKINHSNLCSEINLPNNEEESFVCDLSSMNILHYDEWKDTDAIEVLTFLLDAVMTEFIDKTEDIPFMERSRRFAQRHRALGIGWLGWHSYLQSKMIPFESMQAKTENVKVAKTIKEQAWAASKKLAGLFGEPELLKGYNRRNTTLTAIAPTKSSAFILGQVSEGIEPARSNYYIKDLQKIKVTIKNEFLDNVLDHYGKNTKEVWNSILENSGSVQHLDFLSDLEKDVFKTFIEISPKEIVIQTAQRQKYIDQSQSVNLIIDPKVPAKEVNALLIDAWKMGVKTLYYQISMNASQQLSRSINTCESCGA